MTDDLNIDEVALAIDHQDSLSLSDQFESIVNLGTESVDQEDLNTPILKVLQSNTQGVDGKVDGKLYRTDTHEQLDEVEVNLVHLEKLEIENYNKTGMEKVRIYYGFYADTNEPFKMYLRGWNLVSHRSFQSEVSMLKAKYRVPMFALRVKLTTNEQSGTIATTGKPYTTHMLVFTVLKDAETGKPTIENNPDRVSFLVEAAKRFKDLASASNNPSDDFDGSF